jgi:hypothetical protein
MLELLGQEEEGLTVIDRLNELLEAERAGVDTLSRLFPEALSAEMQKLFEAVRNDEAWSCAGTRPFYQDDGRDHLGEEGRLRGQGDA